MHLKIQFEESISFLKRMQIRKHCMLLKRDNKNNYKDLIAWYAKNYFGMNVSFRTIASTTSIYFSPLH